MQPIIISLMTVPSDQARGFLEAKTFEPDANLSPIDKPPKAILEIKGDVLREKRLKDWKFAQGIKLEQSVLAKRQKAMEDAGKRWWTARLVAVALKPLDGDPVAISGPKEKPILRQLFELLTDKYTSHTLVAKGGKDFHLPFLTGRAIAHDLGLPPQLYSTYPVNDIHELFGRSAMSTQRGSLEDYAFGIGLKTSDTSESAQYLMDQYALGSETALKQMQVQCSEEVTIISELLKRYTKRFPTAKDIQRAESVGESERLNIPF